MDYLAEELKKFYNRSGNKIIFKNGQTLNQLSLSLSEILDFSEFDASVLSRVLSGERLFTFEQLKAFCAALGLSFQEKIALFDYWKYALIDKKADDTFHSAFLSPSNEHIYHLVQSCFKLLYQGKCYLVYEYADAILQAIVTEDNILGELILLLLYLKGRYFGSAGKGSEVIIKTSPIIYQLKRINVDDYELKQGLIYTLHANACYVYSKYTRTHKYIAKGIKLCEKALSLNYIVSEKIFAARAMLSLAILSEDQALIEKTRTAVEEFLKHVDQPSDFTSGYHLLSSIALSFAQDNSSVGFELLKTYQQNYQLNLYDKGNYSLSFIQSKVDMYLALQENDDNFKQLLAKGIQLSSKEQIDRYSQRFQKISNNFS